MEMEAYAQWYGYTRDMVEEYGRRIRVPKVSVQTVIGHRRLVACPRLSLHPRLPQGKLDRGGRPESRTIKGME